MILFHCHFLRIVINISAYTYTPRNTYTQHSFAPTCVLTIFRISFSLQCFIGSFELFYFILVYYVWLTTNNVVVLIILAFVVANLLILRFSLGTLIVLNSFVKLHIKNLIRSLHLPSFSFGSYTKVNLVSQHHYHVVHNLSSLFLERKNYFPFFLIISHQSFTLSHWSIYMAHMKLSEMCENAFFFLCYFIVLLFSDFFFSTKLTNVTTHL